MWLGGGAARLDLVRLGTPHPLEVGQGLVPVVAMWLLLQALQLWAMDGRGAGEGRKTSLCPCAHVLHARLLVRSEVT